MIRYQGQDVGWLLVGADEAVSHDTGTACGRDRRFLVLCGNLFSLPILNTQQETLLSDKCSSFCSDRTLKRIYHMTLQSIMCKHLLTIFIYIDF